MSGPSSSGPADWLQRIDALAKTSPDEALALCDEAVAAFPDDARVHVARGRLLLSLSRDEAAGDSFRHAIRIDPRDVESMLRLARIHAAGGDYGDALKLVATALDLGHKPGLILPGFASLLVDMGDYDRALELLDQAIMQWPSPALEALQTETRARLAADAASGIHPGPKRVFLRAMELLRSGDRAAAVPLFEQVLEDCPDYVPAQVGLGAAAGSPTPGRGRRLSDRGLIFDPLNLFPYRGKDEVLTRVSSPEDLKTADNAYFTIDPGGEAVTCPPVISLGGQDGDPSFASFTSSPKVMASIRNAAVVGRGIVLTEADEIVADFASPNDPAKYGARFEQRALRFAPRTLNSGMCEVRYFDTPSLLLTGPTDTSYGDWIDNFPTRLALAEAVALDCPVLVREHPLPQALDLLARLGVSRDRLLFHQERGVSVFPKLFVCSWPMPHRDRPTLGPYDIYRRISRGRPDAKGPRLYLSRGGRGNRPALNEADVEALFVARGFQVVRPERLSLDEVLDIFANPECVAGPFGSAFRNLVFCANRPPCMQIVPPHGPRFMSGIITWFGLQGLPYGYVTGRPPPATVFSGGANARPWVADLERTERGLDAFLAYVAAHP